MTLQIKSIVLYNADGKTRVLPFQLGAVNIITGKSSTGKTALIPIIEYCMGTGSFRVPDGPVRDTVKFYSVLFQMGETQIFVAKAPPKLEGGQSQSQVFFKAAKEVPIPLMEEITPNSNDDALHDYLSRLLGFSLNKTMAPATRDSIEVSLKFTRPYLFQDDGIIANKDILFHGQNEHPLAVLHIKDTLPYLLGAIPEDFLRLQIELRNAKKELKAQERVLSDAEEESNATGSQAKTLFLEAQDVGLIPPDERPEDIQGYLAALRKTKSWRPKPGNKIDADKVAELRKSLEVLRGKLNGLTDKIDAAQDFAKEEDEYTHEVVAQKLRLESVNLFPKGVDGENACPICERVLNTPVPKADALLGRAKELDQSLSTVTREKPWVQGHIQALEEARQGVRSEMKVVQDQIQSLIREREALKKLEDENTGLSWVLGRISLYLEGKPKASVLAPIKARYEALRKQVEALQEKLSADDVEERLASMLNTIGLDMSVWSNELTLEYKGHPHAFDLKRLTVRIDKKGIPIFMNVSLGSSQNYLGCHLLLLFALHKFFIEQGRPIPGFLILDQPTMGYFPQDRIRYDAMEGAPEDLNDEDREATTSIFTFIFKRCRELAPNLQIIVLEHANLGTDEFLGAMVEDPWRGDRALIPKDWILASEAPPKAEEPTLE